MIDGRRTLRLSLALNAVLVLGAWIGFWFLSTDKLSQLCKPSSVHSLLGDLAEPPLDDSYPQVAVATEPTSKSCDICASGVGKDLCDKYGADIVARTMAFTQGNTRLQRVLAKWRRGKPVRLGVVGGSNSAGQGVWADNEMKYSQLNMHVRLFNYLSKRFPQSGNSVMERTGRHNENSLVNSAQFGKGTEYFAMCSQVHLPEELDLVVVEFAVNDLNNMEATETYEMMIRYLLERDGNPALIEFQTFGYEFDQILKGDASHLATDLYYNIPTIAPRTLFWDGAQRNITKFWDWFYWYNPHETPKDLHGVDLRHFGPGGHKTGADLMEAYIEQQLCEMDRIEAAAGHSDIDKLYPVQPIQRLSLLSQFSREHHDAAMLKMQPACRSIDSDTYPLKPSSSEGWEPWTWRNEETGKEKHYLRAIKPGSKVSFDLGTVTNRVELYFLRSKSFGLGNVKCTLNGEKEEEVVGWWDKPENIGQSMRWRNVEQGEYKLECELLKTTDDPGGGTEFRIMAVMSI